MDHIDIDGVLATANLERNRSDLRELAIPPFPDTMWAEEELRNRRFNSAILPEFQQPFDELTLFSAQVRSTTEMQEREEFPA